MCRKKVLRVASVVLILTFLCCVPALAAGTTGDVAGAVEQTWKDAATQIKTFNALVAINALS